MLMCIVRAAKIKQGLTLVLASALLLLAACERRSPETTTPRDSDLAEQPAHESWETEFYVSEDAVPRAIITAPYTRQYDYKDSTLTIMTSTDAARVVASIFDDSGRKSSTVTANEIRYVEQGRRFEASGEVVVLTESDERLETEHLTWDEESELIFAPGFARIFATDGVYQGYELEATKDLSTYTLARPTGQMYVDD